MLKPKTRTASQQPSQSLDKSIAEAPTRLITTARLIVVTKQLKRWKVAGVNIPAAFVIIRLRELLLPLLLS
jgi:hypothetical protein